LPGFLPAFAKRNVGQAVGLGKRSSPAPKICTSVVANLRGTQTTSFRLLKKPHSILILVFVGLLGCAEKKEVVDSNLEKFRVEVFRSKFDLQFKFPKTFISVRDIDVESLTDTTNVLLDWILNTQYENSEAFCFYDSLDLRLNVLVLAGPRVDISNRERNLTYFTVPTAPLNKIFPIESDTRKMIYDSGEKRYKEKTYYKREFQIMPDSLGVQQYYYLSTTWQSVLVIVNSPKRIDLDKYVLDYELTAKEESAN
jgi:hypothetical protein